MISVVIPVFNQSSLTQCCLKSLLEHSARAPHGVGEVVVINNASTDDTATVLAGFSQSFKTSGIRLQILHNDKNVGFGRACNQGIRESKGEYLAILNNDTWLMPNWDQALMQALEKNQLDLVGPYFDEKPLSENMLDRAQTFIQKNHSGLRHHFVPILMFFKRSAIELLKFDHGGIFDERFFVTYEDTDLKHRMCLAGLKYAQTGSCYIWHRSMGTRSQKGLLPSGYEVEGLRLFIEKWKFDPRDQDHTALAKLRRRFWKLKEKYGLF